MPRSHTLPLIYARVQERAQQLQAAQPGWPCARGCDACCRRLARIPELSSGEWRLLDRALRQLSAPERALCLSRARALAEQIKLRGGQGPWTCPFLDESEGACQVYEGRPLGCRTYGFYAGHHHDAWCDRVAAHVAGVRDKLVCGNLDAVERDHAAVDGPRRGLLSWLLGS